jgi:hypothetical protein
MNSIGSCWRQSNQWNSLFELDVRLVQSSIGGLAMELLSQPVILCIYYIDAIGGRRVDKTPRKSLVTLFEIRNPKKRVQKRVLRFVIYHVGLCL